MQNPHQPPSKIRRILMWTLLVGNLIFWTVFWIWRERGRVPATSSEPHLLDVVLFVLIGGFFLVVGVGSYILCVFTVCLTFDFTRPIWSVVKAKLFLANILVPVAAGLGVGFGFSAFLTPVLRR